MAVRNFDGSSDWIGLTLGTLAGIQSGALTVAAIAKVANDGTYRPLIAFDATGDNTRRGIARYSANTLGMDSSGSEFSAGVTWTAADDWVLILLTKAAGSAVIRGHKYVFGTQTWSHAAGGTTDDDTSTLTDVEIGRWYGDNADTFNGRMAVVGAWKSVVGNDAAIEALGLETALANWVSASPAALWPLNQESTATAVTDITGGGADQSSLSGTTAVTGDDPPGFNFSLAGPSGTAAASVGVALAASGSADAAASAAPSVGVQLDASGSRPSTGSAAFSVATALASTGSAAEEGAGSGAYGIALDLAASGSAPASGSAAFSLANLLAASGPSGEQTVADFGIGLGLLAEAETDHSGSAAFTLGVGLAAAGQQDSDLAAIRISAVSGPARNPRPVPTGPAASRVVTGPAK